MFAQFEYGQAASRQVRYAHGASGIVRFADRYPTIDEASLEHLMAHTDATGVKVMNYDLLQGDRVRISDGIFAGLDAVVVKVLPAKEKVRVLMEFLGRKIEAEVDHGSVLRQTAHPLAA